MEVFSFLLEGGAGCSQKGSWDPENLNFGYVVTYVNSFEGLLFSSSSLDTNFNLFQIKNVMIMFLKNERELPTITTIETEEE